MRRDAVGDRGADTVAHLDRIALDRDAALGVDLDTTERGVSAGAVILGDAGHASADQNARLLSALLLFRALAPDRMLLKLVEDLRRAHRHDIFVARHGTAVGL